MVPGVGRAAGQPLDLMCWLQMAAHIEEGGSGFCRGPLQCSSATPAQDQHPFLPMFLCWLTAQACTASGA